MKIKKIVVELSEEEKRYPAGVSYMLMQMINSTDSPNVLGVPFDIEPLEEVDITTSDIINSDGFLTGRQIWRLTF